MAMEHRPVRSPVSRREPRAARRARRPDWRRRVLAAVVRRASEIAATARRNRLLPGRGRGTAGFSLFEIMIVVVIIAMLSTGVAVGATYYLKRSRVSNTRSMVETVRTAVHTYLVDNPGTCPSIDQLVGAGVLDRNKGRTDAWNHAFHIDCAGGEATVWSDGPDLQPNTEDDIPQQHTTQASNDNGNGNGNGNGN
jgi:general secretion pathway protein G